MNSFIKNLFLLILALNNFNISYANSSNSNIDYESIIKHEKQKLSLIKQTANEQEKECYKRFFINNCINKIKKEFYKQSDEIEHKILGYKQEIRQKNFDEEQLRIKQANQKFENEAIDREMQKQKNIGEFEYKQNKDDTRIKN